MKSMFQLHLLIGLFVIALAGCGPIRITRTSSAQVTDLSGRWNDTDSRLTAEKMLKDINNAPWLDRFKKLHTQQMQSALLEAEASGKALTYTTPKPVLIVGTILNKSHEHIESETFIKDLEGELVKAGAVRIVANSVFREKLREARVEQVGFVTPETQKRFGGELGADYMLFGTINTIVDTEGDNKVVFYQINLELIDLETNEIVWIGNKKIKKYRGKRRIKRRYKNAVPKD